MALVKLAASELPNVANRALRGEDPREIDMARVQESAERALKVLVYREAG